MTSPIPYPWMVLRRLVNAAALGLQFVEEYATQDKPLADIARRAARETEAALDAAALALRQPYREPTQAERDLEEIKTFLANERIVYIGQIGRSPNQMDVAVNLAALFRTVVRLAERRE